MAGFMVMDSSVFKDPLFGSPSNSVSESLTPVNTPARAFNKSPAPTGYMSAEKAKKASPVAQAISSPGLVARVELENAETLVKQLSERNLLAQSELAMRDDSINSLVQQLEQLEQQKEAELQTKQSQITDLECELSEKFANMCKEVQPFKLEQQLSPEERQKATEPPTKPTRELVSLQQKLGEAKEIAIAACRSQTEERAQHEEVQERAADLERQRLVAVQELVECQDSCQSWQLVSLAMGSIAAVLAFRTIQRL